MAKYIVSMAVNGRIDVEVESESTEEAFKGALGGLRDSRRTNQYEGIGDSCTL